MTHTESLDHFTHHHNFLGGRHDRNARRTWAVVALTAAMTVVEVVGGWLSGSMALLADGIHMATHAGALGVAGFAYWFARRHVDDPRFTFGTGKVGDLAGFSSALVLAAVALGIGFESLVRFAHPVSIAFEEAVAIAVLGLAVNLASAWLLGDSHEHAYDDIERSSQADGDHRKHDHGNNHGHERHEHHDHNLRSAYFHVLADALTSVLAIAALLAVHYLGWTWADPLMGVVGAIVIARWSVGLLRDTAAVLVDAAPHRQLAHEIRQRIETGGDRIADLHLWRVGPGRQAAIVSLVTHRPQDAAVYKQRLADLPVLAHVTVEVSRCPDDLRAAQRE
jgi:cation diffusion facilitator family transporter